MVLDAHNLGPDRSGLSATIGHPEEFNEWLQSVQHAHGFKHSFINHPHRYSHLRKFDYALDIKPSRNFSGLDTYQNSGRLRFLHPVSLAAFGAQSLPPDFSLEAADCLSLYQALREVSQDAGIDCETLAPARFFRVPGLLKQKDVISYETALKESLQRVTSVSDPQDEDSPLARVVQMLQDPAASADYVPTPRAIKANLIHLVSDLYSNGDLVSIIPLQQPRVIC